MILNRKSITLIPYTIEYCHAFYRNYVADSFMTETPFVYDEYMIDLYYQTKVKDINRLFFGISYNGNIIGEIQLKRIDTIRKCATLSIILTNDSVKNKGFGTEAERLLIQYAFNQLNFFTIYADAIHRNTRSKHVLEKIGFRHIHDDEILAYYKLDRSDFQ